MGSLNLRGGCPEAEEGPADEDNCSSAGGAESPVNRKEGYSLKK